MKFERRLRLYIVARIVVVVLFLVSTVLLKLSDTEAIGIAQFRSIVALTILACLFSGVSLVLLQHQEWQASLARLQIIWDVLFVTLLLMLTDGIASPYSFFYLLVTMSAGMLLNRQQALYTAALCAILYGAMVDMQYYGMLKGIGLSPETAQQRGDVVLFYTLFLHLVGFALAAIMGGHLTERARITEHALRVTEVNYEELKQLHSSIVENLESGLMTMTKEGLIRVFNPYLEKLTGLTQAQAYGRPVETIFSALKVGETLPARHLQGEFSYKTQAGDPLLLGYATIPFKNLQGQFVGLIVTIRDLTSLKQMELALKRADRLAALGELSARMAHEIRNPLAAISGSVQLLSEHGSLQDHESRLLTIVMRESDRLNGLISDFLAYARPRQPHPQQFELHQLVADLQALLARDNRFEQVKVLNTVPSGTYAWADRDQLYQVLMNLMQNSAEAMPDGGEVSVNAEFQSGVDDAGNSFALLCLKIADHGTGMHDETRKHLFEPFWTTKPNGTGLGLATVYRIVEAHGGMVQADPRDGGGTVVTILLPMLEEEQGENQNPGC